WLAGWMGERHGLAVRLTAPEGIPPLPEAVQVLLFESVRELLFNTVKYAGIRSARVEVRATEGKELRLVVSDAGRGFDPAGLKPAGQEGSGFGLFTIR